MLLSTSKTNSKLSIIDAELILGLFFCLIGAIGLWFIHTPQFWRSAVLDKGGMLLGSVERHEGQVRYRPGGIPLWVDVSESQKTQAFSGGAVYTGPGSRATLQITDGPTVEIEERSLLVLDYNTKGETRLDLGDSKVKVTFAKKGQSVVISSGGKTVKLKSQRAGTVLETAVRQGAVQTSAIETKDFEVTQVESPPERRAKDSVIESQAISELQAPMAVPQIAQTPTDATPPQPEAMKEEEKPVEPVVLSPVVARTTWWNSNDDDAEDGSNVVRLEIEAPAAFKKNEKWTVNLYSKDKAIADESTSSRKIVFLLNEKLARLVKQYEIEGVGRGDVSVQKDAPKITKIIDQKENILIVWGKTVFTEGYDVQISRTPQFSKRSPTKRYTRNFIVLKSASWTGAYIRLRSKYTNGYSAWSEPVKIQP